MHPLALSQTVPDRIAQRRGRLPPFEAIEPQKTALAAVDMQNRFCAPGAAGEVADAFLSADASCRARPRR
jgi:hypothetical protein